MKLIPVGPIVSGKDAAGVRFELVARVYREGLAHSQRGDRFVRARLTHAKGSWLGFFPDELQASAGELQEGEAIRMEARRLQHKFADDSLRIERWVRLPADRESLSGILCVRHNMARRSLYAEQEDEGGAAVDSEGVD